MTYVVWFPHDGFEARFESFAHAVRYATQIEIMCDVHPAAIEIEGDFS